MSGLKKIVGNYYYYINDKLGQGVSSMVYKGFDQKTSNYDLISDQTVAIKIVTKGDEQKQMHLKMVQTQLKFLQLLKGKPNILQLHSTIQTKNNIYIISDLCEKGTVSELLSEKRKFSQEEAQKYILQIIRGYKSVGEHGIIHRDIKPENILVNSSDKVMIGDFGLSMQNNKQKLKQQGLVGSPFYMAPQLLDEQNQEEFKYSCKSDIWAIGITYFEMLTGRRPWKSRMEQELMQEIRSFDIEKVLPLNLSNKSKLFLRRSLCVKPQIRMSFNELLKFEESYSNSQGFSQQIIVNQKSKITVSQPISSKKSIESTNLQQKSQVFSEFREEKVINPSEKIHRESPRHSSSSNQSPMLKVKKGGIKSNLQMSPVVHIEVDKQNESKKQKLIGNKDGRMFTQTVSFNLQEIQEQPPYHPNNLELLSNQLTMLPSKQEQAFRQRKQSFQLPTEQKLGEIKQERRKKERKQSLGTETNSDYLLFNNAKAQVKTRSRKQSFQVAQLANIIHQFNDPQKNKSPTTKEQCSVEKVKNKDILKQLQGHINYFRLIFRIFRKIKDSLKTNDQKINSFKNQLLYLFYQAIKESRQMKLVKNVTEDDLKRFKKSSYHNQLVTILQEYQRRYQRQQERQKMILEFKGEQIFGKLLMHVMKILVQNVVIIQKNDNDLDKKKQLVFIIEDLMIFRELQTDFKTKNWHKADTQTGLSKHLDKKIPDRVDFQYWRLIKEPFLKLIKK